jgi:hypothetical protein
MKDALHNRLGLKAPAPRERANLAQGLRRIFPLPPSGAFSDLLDAIDYAEMKSRR